MKTLCMWEMTKFILRQKRSSRIDWSKYDVDVVYECAGKFNSKNKQKFI